MCSAAHTAYNYTHLVMAEDDHAGDKPEDKAFCTERERMYHFASMVEPMVVPNPLLRGLMR